MASFFEKLIELSDAEEGIYLEFLLQYKFNDRTFHFFFEGYEDPSFYNGFIENIIPTPRVQYITNGKYKAYNLFRQINWRTYKKNRVLFFIDRDYTELVGETLLKDENIYTTEYYSIENHLVCKNILERCILEILHISKKEVIDDILNKFEYEYDKFFRSIWYLIGWIIFMKREGEKIVLNDIDLNNLVKFSEDCCVKSKGGKQTGYIEKITGAKTPPNSGAKILAVIREIKQSNPKLVIRGKFEVWFFINFINHYKTHLINSKGLSFNQKTQLTIANFIEVCAPRFKMLDSLRVFLESNLAKA